MSGLLITIEGPEGAGKTSIMQSMVPLLRARAKTSVITTREPGGIPIAEEIREVILSSKNEGMDNKTEALLFIASRREHLVKKVLPALKDDKVVIIDRFIDSSLAYQGVGRDLGIRAIESLNEFATDGIKPQLTLYLDVEVEEGLSRIEQNRVDEVNRIDLTELSFHKKVREGYLEIAHNNPERVAIIDASQTFATVVREGLNVIIQRFPEWFSEIKY
ncbi:MAG: dTMP kinase [Lactobacillales bacterium]|nr:dTMP kinase [Lactobacillales bacterium]